MQSGSAPFTQFSIPPPVLTDSYKAGHYYQYPEAKKMVAYGEFRTPYRGSTEHRFVFYGIRYFIETYLSRRWTEKDVEDAVKFYATHNAGFTEYPFPKDIFLKFVRENDGYFPVRIEALPEGTCAHIHTPVYQITAEGEYARLVTFLETMITEYVWYGSTVATLSRRAREVLEQAYERSVDEKDWWSLDFRLHDFGFRGCTCLEQSIVGGSAHLLSFDGTDTMSAAYYAQYHLNNGKPVAQSIPATEHSVMTSWRTEREAILNMIKHFGSGTYSIVMDSYDYAMALERVIPSIKNEKVEKGGYLVIRPDSGDPKEVVLMGLRAGEKVFGAEVNSKGYKRLIGCGVIQGDGVQIDVIQKLTQAVLEAGYAANNVVYGMGGALLQRVDRDTMSFATKLNYIEYADGTKHDVMKKPRSDSGKISLPGVLQVRRVNGIPTVFPADPDGPRAPDNLLRVVYDRRPLLGVWDDFETVRKRARTEWKALPQVHDPISAELKEKIKNWIANHKLVYD